MVPPEQPLLLIERLKRKATQNAEHLWELKDNLNFWGGDIFLNLLTLPSLINLDIARDSG